MNDRHIFDAGGHLRSFRLPLSSHGGQGLQKSQHLCLGKYYPSMQAGSTFVDTLFGPDWTAQGVAVVIASVLALIAASVTAVVAIWQGRKTRGHASDLDAKQADREREFKGREQWWERFTWAATEATSPDQERKTVAVTVLASLSSSPWANDEDRLLVAQAFLDTTIKPDAEEDIE